MAKRSPTRLPKAPLTEVVFELRWRLQGGSQLPAIVHADPGLLPLIETFTAAMRKKGFTSFKDMAPALQTGAYGVARRFYRGTNRPYPLMQIGPGIFATNQSSQYEWKSFQSQIISGIQSLLESYPKLDFFSLTPNYLELRYIGAFDRSLVGSSEIYDFMAKGTSIKINFPNFLVDKETFDGETKGRLLFQRPLKSRKHTLFSVDIGSGRNNDTQQDIIRMETKFLSQEGDVPKLLSSKKFPSAIKAWASSAHDVTSQFFKALIVPEVMQKFG